MALKILSTRAGQDLSRNGSIIMTASRELSYRYCQPSPRASSWVRSAAGIARQPWIFCPAHSGEKSAQSTVSARARNGAMALVASGNVGATVASGPSSRIRRLTMLRAGRPENKFVNAVWRAASLTSAARCKALVLASGHNRYPGGRYGQPVGVRRYHLAGHPRPD